MDAKRVALYAAMAVIALMHLQHRMVDAFSLSPSQAGFSSRAVTSFKVQENRVKFELASSLDNEQEKSLMTVEIEQPEGVLGVRFATFKGTVKVNAISDAATEEAKDKLSLGDEILSVNGVRYSADLDLAAAIRSIPVGETIQLSVRRKGLEPVQEQGSQEAVSLPPLASVEPGTEKAVVKEKPAFAQIEITPDMQDMVGTSKKDFINVANVAESSKSEGGIVNTLQEFFGGVSVSKEIGVKKTEKELPKVLIDLPEDLEQFNEVALKKPLPSEDEQAELMAKLEEPPRNPLNISLPLIMEGEEEEEVLDSEIRDILKDKVEDLSTQETLEIQKQTDTFGVALKMVDGTIIVDAIKDEASPDILEKLKVGDEVTAVDEVAYKTDMEMAAAIREIEVGETLCLRVRRKIEETETEEAKEAALVLDGAVEAEPVAIDEPATLIDKKEKEIEPRNFGPAPGTLLRPKFFGTRENFPPQAKADAKIEEIVALMEAEKEGSKILSIEIQKSFEALGVAFSMVEGKISVTAVSDDAPWEVIDQLKVDDCILSVNGVKYESGADVANAIIDMEVGDIITFQVKRKAAVEEPVVEDVAETEVPPTEEVAAEAEIMIQTVEEEEEEAEVIETDEVQQEVVQPRNICPAPSTLLRPKFLARRVNFPPQAKATAAEVEEDVAMEILEEGDNILDVEIQKSNEALGIAFNMIDGKISVAALRDDAPREVLDQLKVGDCILSVNGMKYKSDADVATTIRETEVGGIITFQVRRKDNETLNVNIQKSNEALGVAFNMVDGQIFVDAVRADAPWEVVDKLKVGDCIFSVNGVRYESDADVATTIRETKLGDIITFQVKREAKVEEPVAEDVAGIELPSIEEENYLQQNEEALKLIAQLQKEKEAEAQKAKILLQEKENLQKRLILEQQERENIQKRFELQKQEATLQFEEATDALKETLTLKQQQEATRLQREKDEIEEKLAMQLEQETKLRLEKEELEKKLAQMQKALLTEVEESISEREPESGTVGEVQIPENGKVGLSFNSPDVALEEADVAWLNQINLPGSGAEVQVPEPEPVPTTSEVATKSQAQEPAELTYTATEVQLLLNEVVKQAEALPTEPALQKSEAGKSQAEQPKLFFTTEEVQLLLNEVLEEVEEESISEPTPASAEEEVLYTEAEVQLILNEALKQTEATEAATQQDAGEDFEERIKLLRPPVNRKDV